MCKMQYYVTAGGTPSYHHCLMKFFKSSADSSELVVLHIVCSCLMQYLQQSPGSSSVYPPVSWSNDQTKVQFYQGSQKYC